MQMSGVCSQRRPSKRANRAPRFEEAWRFGWPNGLGPIQPILLRVLGFVLLGCLGMVIGPRAGGAPSDAMILVQPMGSRVIVAIVFPKLVSHKLLEARIRKLAQSTGWSVENIQIQDEAVRLGGKLSGYGKPIKETGATVFLQNAPQARDGGFLLQPYLNAFADLDRIEILYMTPPYSDFQGLRSFESPALSVRLIRAGGPYHYIAEIRNHTSPLPILPLTQAAEAPRVRQEARGPSSLAGEIGLVCAAASMAGLATMAVLLVQLRIRARMRPATRRKGQQVPPADAMP